MQQFKKFLSYTHSKLWLVGMFSAGKKQYLQEVVDPIIKYFDGVVATFHYPVDETADYLESIRGQGEILYTKWCCRNDLSRNIYLWQGPMKNFDWFINIDENEAINPIFFESKLDILLQYINKYHIDGFVLHGKRFMYQYNDFLEHVGNPHEGIRGASQVVELTQLQEFKTSEEYFENLRPKRRDPFVFIDAFLRYYLGYPNSNHCLLGLENNKELFFKREGLRQKFRVYVQIKLCIDTTVDALKTYIDNHGLNDDLRMFFNSERILNEWYRYHYLNDRNIENYKDERLIKL